MESSVLGDKD